MGGSDYPTHERTPVRLSDVATVYNRKTIKEIKGKRCLLVSMGLVTMIPLSALFFIFISSNFLPYILLFSIAAILVIALTSKKYLSNIQDPSEGDVLVYSIANSIAPSVPFFIYALWPCSGLNCIGRVLFFVIGVIVIPVMFVIAKVTASAILRRIIIEGAENDSALQTSVAKKEKLVDKLINTIIILYSFFVIFAGYIHIFVFLRPAMIAVLIYSIVAMTKNKADCNKMAKAVLCMMVPAVIDITIWNYPLIKVFNGAIFNFVYDSRLSGTLTVTICVWIAAISTKYMIDYIKSDKKIELSRVAVVIMAIIEIIIQIVAAYVAVFGWTLGKFY